MRPDIKPFMIVVTRGYLFWSKVVRRLTYFGFGILYLIAKSHTMVVKDRYKCYSAELGGFQLVDFDLKLQGADAWVYEIIGLTDSDKEILKEEFEKRLGNKYGLARYLLHYLRTNQGLLWIYSAPILVASIFISVNFLLAWITIMILVMILHSVVLPKELATEDCAEATGIPYAKIGVWKVDGEYNVLTPDWIWSLLETLRLHGKVRLVGKKVGEEWIKITKQ